MQSTYELRLSAVIQVEFASPLDMDFQIAEQQAKRQALQKANGDKASI